MGHGLTHFSSACTKAPQSDLRHVKHAGAKGLTRQWPGGRKGQGNICVLEDNRTGELLLEGKLDAKCGSCTKMSLDDKTWHGSKKP